MKTTLAMLAAVAWIAASGNALAGQSDGDKKDEAKPASPAQMAAAEKPAQQSKDPAAEEKKLVLPNASDYVNDGVACGTAK